MSDKKIVLDIVNNMNDNETFEEILCILFKNFLIKRGNEIMKKYMSEEELERDIIEKLKIAEEQIERGEVIPAEVVFAELEKKYGNKKI